MMDYDTAALIVGIVVNFLFLCGAIYGFVDQANHRKRVKSDAYAEVEGKVVDFRIDQNLKGRSKDKVEYAIYEFVARDGKTYRYCLESLTSSMTHIGDTKILLYLVEDPTKCEPRDHYFGYILAFVMLGCIAAYIYGAYSMGNMMGM